MNLYEKYINCTHKAKESISTLIPDDLVFPSLSGKKLIFNHSQEALNEDGYVQFTNNIKKCGFDDGEWIFIDANMASDFKNVVHLDYHYYRVKRFLQGHPGFPFTDKFIDKLIESKKTRRYICYNGTAQSHRLIFLNGLYNKNLIEKGMISLLEKPDDEDFGYTRDQLTHENRVDQFKELKSTHPFFKNAPYVITEHPHHTILYSTHRDTGPAGGKDLWCSIDRTHLLNTFFSVVPETVFFDAYWCVNKNHLFVTEKTYKSIAHNPTIVLGRPHTLKYLKSLGFKTFSDIFDESYDNIENDWDRYEAVMSLVETLCKMDYIELKSKYEKSFEVILHNQRVFLNDKNTYSKKLKELIGKY